MISSVLFTVPGLGVISLAGPFARGMLYGCFLASVISEIEGVPF